MELLLITAIPVIILLIWGSKISRDKRFFLKLLCVPFALLVAFYSFIIALGILLAYFVYWKFVLSKRIQAQEKEEDYPQIRWQ